MRLLVTRPEPDGARTADELRALGHEVMVAPLLRIETMTDVELGAGPWAAVLLTSANGARALADHARRAELMILPAFAVGQASAAAARAAGFSDVTSADGDGGDLTRLVAARFAGAGKPLLYPAGLDRARDVGGDLARHGHQVETVVLYRTVAAAAFPPEVRAALRAGAVDGVLHFSRRSVQSYLVCAREVLAEALAPIQYCLAARISEPLAAAGAGQIRVAPRPDEAALLALI